MDHCSLCLCHELPPSGPCTAVSAAAVGGELEAPCAAGSSGTAAPSQRTDVKTRPSVKQSLRKGRKRKLDDADEDRYTYVSDSKRGEPPLGRRVPPSPFMAKKQQFIEVTWRRILSVKGLTMWLLSFCLHSKALSGFSCTDRGEAGSQQTTLLHLPQESRPDR